jgi:fatty acid desaturase
MSDSSLNLTPARIRKVLKDCTGEVIPKIAWPTVLLITCCVIVELSVAVALHYDMINKFVALAINFMAIFAAFTPMHDGVHGSIGRSQISL